MHAKGAIQVHATGTNASSTRKNVGPRPQRFAIDTDRPGHGKAVALSSLATVLRLGAGALVDGYSFSMEKQRGDDVYAVVKAGPFRSVERGSRSKTPEQMLTIFAKMDGPGRKVREALSILDLDACVYPSTRSWTGMGFDHRQQTLVMRDPNAGKELFDADDIVEYLFNTYGSGVDAVPWVMKRENAIGAALMKVAVWLRSDHGTEFNGNSLSDSRDATDASMVDPTTFEFWAYEASPFCGVAAEAIYAAGLPHVLKTVARGSSKRDVLFEAEGHFQAPFILVRDEAGGMEGMFESTAIIEYVDSRYRR